METAVKPEAAASEDLGAPLYVAWQITNECNLACLHCIEESGPGKAFKDELSTEEALSVIDQLVKNEVPYVSFSGGEPMVRPDFFQMVERITSGGVGLKIETNGHYLTPENCKRLRTST
jgi:MoaA/NifB/PqqE/SkfB family radical SAM enzyme